MNIGPTELIILLILLAFVVLPVWGIIDAATKPEPLWLATGQNKVVWVLVQIFLGALGAAVYFLAIRPKLKAAGSGLSRPPMPSS